MHIFYCLEAGFAWSNSIEVSGPFSFLHKNDFNSVVRSTVDGAWYGCSHKWTTDAKYYL